MKQEQFVARHQAEWTAFACWLAGGRGDVGFPDEEFAPRYRRIAQQLALARRRGYSPAVTVHLQDLMEQGHQRLYRAAPVRWLSALEFLLAGFPRLVRSEAGCMLAALALFVLPLVSTFVVLQFHPELVHGLFDSSQIAAWENMYDPSIPRHGRESQDSWYMFGYYISHNVSIGLSAFASGLVVGVGSVVVLVSNGIIIGAVFGHLHHIGSGGRLWSFVCGHAPFELTAIVLAGGAGLQLGLNWLMPGRRARGQALREAGIKGGQLCIGVVAMLVIAAFIEAFWSSKQQVPVALDYSVSVLLWGLVLGWLLLGGRRRVEHLRAQ